MITLAELGAIALIVWEQNKILAQEVNQRLPPWMTAVAGSTKAGMVIQIVGAPEGATIDVAEYVVRRYDSGTLEMALYKVGGQYPLTMELGAFADTLLWDLERTLVQRLPELGPAIMYLGDINRREAAEAATDAPTKEAPR